MCRKTKLQEKDFNIRIIEEMRMQWDTECIGTPHILASLMEGFPWWYSHVKVGQWPLLGSHSFEAGGGRKLWWEKCFFPLESKFLVLDYIMDCISYITHMNTLQSEKNNINSASKICPNVKWRCNTAPQTRVL